MPDFIFKEEQKFTQWWLWVLLAIVAVSLSSITLYQLYEGNPFSDNPVVFTILGSGSLIALILLITFSSLKMTTEADSEGIRVRFAPFVNRKFYWKEMKSAEVIDYGFVGGWGVRLFTRYGTVYNVQGSDGLYMQLKNGKKYVIGTQRPDELSELVNDMVTV
ncbi:MAG: hypothetical protein KJP00_13425 [Bacteroidia bacterium]|nr:hypothetical protein [Bacteroidia bacterium]